MNYSVIVDYYPRNIALNKAYERANGKYKIYTDLQFGDLLELDAKVSDNCMQKFGNILFSTAKVADQIVKDACEENGDPCYNHMLAQFIAIMFKQAIFEGFLPQKTQKIIEDYVYKYNKNYFFKLSSGNIIFKEIYDYNNYAEALFNELIEFTNNSSLIGEPFNLEYGKKRYSKCNELKPNEDGTKLISCSLKEASNAAGYSDELPTEEEIKKINLHLEKIKNLRFDLKLQGKTDDEIDIIIKKMRTEGHDI